MSRPDRFWEQLRPTPLLGSADPAQPDIVSPRTRRDWLVDVLVFVLAGVLGGLVLGLASHDGPQPPRSLPLALELAIGLLCSSMLWWRRRWPVGVALATLLVGFHREVACAVGAVDQDATSQGDPFLQPEQASARAG